MPIALKCAACKARLGVPDTAAGTKVKCPRCAAMVAVPGGEDDFDVVEDDIEVVEDDFEVVDDEPKAKPKPAPKKRPRFEDDDDDRPRKPAKRRAIVDDDDDDDEDDDDRPRKKKGKGRKKPPPKSNNMPLLIGGGVLALVLLGVGGFFIFGGDKNKSGGGGSSSEWVTFNAPDGTFSVSMPSTPSATDVGAQATMMGADPKEAQQAMEMVKAQGLNINSWSSTAGSRNYIVTTLALPAEAAAQVGMFKSTMQQSQKQQLSKVGTMLGDETFTIAGQATTFTRVKLNNGKTLISGTLVSGTLVVDLTIVDDNELATTDPNFRKFIESLTVNAAAAPAPAPGAGGGLRRGR